MSRAVGVKKSQEAQKAKALWKMKAAKDAGEEYYDPTREENIFGKKQDKISILGRAPQRSDCGVGQGFEMCCKFVLESLGPSVPQWPVLASSKLCGKSRSVRRLALLGSDG